MKQRIVTMAITRFHNPIQFICEHCEEVFTDEGRLEYHKGLKHGAYDMGYGLDDTPHCCIECMDEFEDSTQLAIHNKMMHQEEDGYLANNSSDDDDELYGMIMGENIHLCKYCNDVFDKKSKLDDHIFFCHSDIVFADESISCRYCDKSFNAQINLYRHTQKHHWEEQQEDIKNRQLAIYDGPPGLEPVEPILTLRPPSPKIKFEEIKIETKVNVKRKKILSKHCIDGCV